MKYSHNDYIDRNKKVDTFKIGDWVINDVYINNSKYPPFQVTQQWLNNTLDQLHIFKLWKPTKGEWCVFWGDAHVGKEYIIKKYDHRKADGYYCYQNIAPLEFLQTLRNN